MTKTATKPAICKFSRLRVTWSWVRNIFWVFQFLNFFFKIWFFLQNLIFFSKFDFFFKIWFFSSKFFYFFSPDFFQVFLFFNFLERLKSPQNFEYFFSFFENFKQNIICISYFFYFSASFISKNIQICRLIGARGLIYHIVGFWHLCHLGAFRLWSRRGPPKRCN